MIIVGVLILICGGVFHLVNQYFKYEKFEERVEQLERLIKLRKKQAKKKTLGDLET